MFDNSLVLYFPENGEGHHSCAAEMPFVIMTGNDCQLDRPGRHIRLPCHDTEGYKITRNRYSKRLNVHGNPVKHRGDLDLEMSRKKLHQVGAIKQRMS